MKNLQKGFVLPLIIAIVIILVIGGGVYYYSQSKNAKTNINIQNDEIYKVSDSLKEVTLLGVPMEDLVK